MPRVLIAFLLAGCIGDVYDRAAPDAQVSFIEEADAGTCQMYPEWRRTFIYTRSYGDSDFAVLMAQQTMHDGVGTLMCQMASNVRVTHEGEVPTVRGPCSLYGEGMTDGLWDFEFKRGGMWVQQGLWTAEMRQIGGVDYYAPR